MIAKGTRQDLRDQAAKALPEITLDAAGLAHDIRTPLAIIMLEAQLLDRQLGARASVLAQRALERIVQNAAYVDRLVADLLDQSSIDAGRLQLRLAPVDLARLLGDTLDRAVSSLDRLRVNIEIRDVLYVQADSARLERVIANLLGNALKFSPDSLVTLRLDGDEDHACIAVIDSGPGLTPEQASTIFERHERTTEARNHDGHGLGLHICQQIIDAHGGRIGVTCTPGNGSRFFFELPTIPNPQPPRSG